MIPRPSYRAPLLAELRSRLPRDARVTADPPARWCTDFGRAHRGVPRLAVETRGDEDVARVLTFARSHGLPVTVRGAGHSCNGQTVSDGGLLLLCGRPRDEAPIMVREDGRAQVAAGAHWREVERVLNRAGRTVPVLADYLDLSVGGTLSVGCYGIDSIRHGAQVEHVDQVRLVRPDGTASWCSPTEEPELFAASLAGLGAVGVVTRAVLRTVPYHPLTTLDVQAHAGWADLAETLAALDSAAGTGPTAFKALVARGRHVSTFGTAWSRWRDAVRAPAPAPLAGRRRVRRFVVPRYRAWRSLTVSLWLRRFPGRCRLWADYVLSGAALPAFLDHLEARLRADPTFASHLKSVYVLAIRSRPTLPLPLEAAAAVARPLAFGVGLYCMVPPQDAAALEGVRAALADCLGNCLALGGRPYLYGAHRLDPQTMALCYGEDWERLTALRRRLDPLGLFQPGALP